MGRVKDVLIDREENIFPTIEKFCAGELSEAQFRAQLRLWLFTSGDEELIISGAKQLKHILDHTVKMFDQG